MLPRHYLLIAFTGVLLLEFVHPATTDSIEVTPADIEEEEVETEDETSAVTLSAADQKPEETTEKEPVKETVATDAPPLDRSTAVYRLADSNGVVCVMVQVDGLIEVEYTTKSEERRSVDTFIPNEASTGGNCKEVDTALFEIRWKSYVLTWNFEKTPGGERWYLDKMALSFNTSELLFEHIKTPGRLVHLSTSRSHSAMLFPTPVGKSYSCQEETSVELLNGDTRATVFLRDFRVQPFLFKSSGFGDEYECSPGGVGSFRDETAPIAVGSTLAIVVLLTVTGYGVWRYFKIKKVQYDTME